MIEVRRELSAQQQSYAVLEQSVDSLLQQNSSLTASFDSAKDKAKEFEANFIMSSKENARLADLVSELTVENSMLREAKTALDCDFMKKSTELEKQTLLVEEMTREIETQKNDWLAESVRSTNEHKLLQNKLRDTEIELLSATATLNSINSTLRDNKLDEQRLNDSVAAADKAIVFEKSDLAAEATSPNFNTVAKLAASNCENDEKQSSEGCKVKDDKPLTTDNCLREAPNSSNDDNSLLIVDAVLNPGNLAQTLATSETAAPAIQLIEEPVSIAEGQGQSLCITDDVKVVLDENQATNLDKSAEHDKVRDDTCVPYTSSLTSAAAVESLVSESRDSISVTNNCYQSNPSVQSHNNQSAPVPNELPIVRSRLDDFQASVAARVARCQQRFAQVWPAPKCQPNSSSISSVSQGHSHEQWRSPTQLDFAPDLVSSSSSLSRWKSRDLCDFPSTTTGVDSMVADLGTQETKRRRLQLNHEGTKKQSQDDDTLQCNTLVALLPTSTMAGSGPCSMADSLTGAAAVSNLHGILHGLYIG